jgi:hypothetical protein
MRKYLICYWAERNDCATDLEELVDANNIMEALEKFIAFSVFKRITSISEVINPNYTPDFDYETRT